MNSLLGKKPLILPLLLIPSLVWPPAGLTSDDTRDLLKSGAYDQVIAAIQASISASEATALDYFILCAAHNRAGEYPDAITAGLTAQRLNYFSDALDLELGYAYLNSGNNQEAKKNINKYLSRHPDDTFANELLARTGEPSPGQSKGRDLKDHFRFWLTPNMGYSSNPLALSDAQMLPSEYSSEEDSYLGLSFGANYRQNPGIKEGFYASYSLSTRFYDDFSDYDSQFHRLSVGYKSRLSKRMGLTILGGWNTYLLDNDSFRNQFLAGAELSGRWSYHHRSILRVSHHDNDYRFAPLLERLDRSGDQQELKLEHQWLQNQTRYSGGIILDQNNADGSDYDFYTVGAFVGLTQWLPNGGVTWLTGKPVLKLSATYTERDYKNPSIFNIASDRDDDVVVYSASLQLPLLNRYSVSFACSRRDQSSNVGVFEFDQNNCNVGFAHLF